MTALRIVIALAPLVPAIFLDAETKVYRKPTDAEAPRTTVIPGRGIQTFQTAGLFKLEAIGEPNRQVQYGYVLLGLRK
jgi:hypothetical protein